MPLIELDRVPERFLSNRVIAAIQRQQRSEIMRPSHVRISLERLATNLGRRLTIADLERAKTALQKGLNFATRL